MIRDVLSRRRGEPRCRDCRYFQGAPEAVEARLPGLTVLGSAYASVAAGNGLCRKHDTYGSGHDRCRDFMAPDADAAGTPTRGK
jgi:hypothetical protein